MVVKRQKKKTKQREIVSNVFDHLGWNYFNKLLNLALVLV